MIKQGKHCFQYERFWLVAVDNEDESYFVGRIKLSAIQPDSFFWCGASQPLILGDLVTGFLHKPNGVSRTPVIRIVNQRTVLMDFRPTPKD
ncbi:MAG: hypothetical protein SAK29_39340 [Scytonema sp. PMC 1069.18]|nr:hypothetical protein [Scytonema sp. PMC 1069.18]MEC4883050.1 hypothetical protein [Scytonema sp. PMC 1070.18]